MPAESRGRTRPLSSSDPSEIPAFTAQSFVLLTNRLLIFYKLLSPNKVVRPLPNNCLRPQPFPRRSGQPASPPSRPPFDLSSLIYYAESKQKAFSLGPTPPPLPPLPPLSRAALSCRQQSSLKFNLSPPPTPFTRALP